VVAQLMPACADGVGHRRIGRQPPTDSHHRRYGLMRGEHVEYRGGDSQIALAAEGQRHLLAVPRAAPPRWPGRRGAGRCAWPAGCWVTRWSPQESAGWRTWWLCTPPTRPRRDEQGTARCTHGRSGSGPVMSGIRRMVDSNRGESCRLAPAVTRATGMPRPSVTTERLVPCLPRSTRDRPEVPLRRAIW